MTSIYFSRESTFTKLILRVEGMARATLADTPAKAYIVQSGCRFWLIPGVVIGGCFRAKGATAPLDWWWKRWVSNPRDVTRGMDAQTPAEG